MVAHRLAVAEVLRLVAVAGSADLLRLVAVALPADLLHLVASSARSRAGRWRRTGWPWLKCCAWWQWPGLPICCAWCQFCQVEALPVSAHRPAVAEVLRLVAVALPADLLRLVAVAGSADLLHLVASYARSKPSQGSGSEPPATIAAHCADW